MRSAINLTVCEIGNKAMKIANNYTAYIWFIMSGACRWLLLPAEGAVNQSLAAAPHLDEDFGHGAQWVLWAGGLGA